MDRIGWKLDNLYRCSVIDGFGSELENTNFTVSFWINYTNISEVWMPFGTQNDNSGTSMTAYINANISEAVPFNTAGTVNYLTLNLRDEFRQQSRTQLQQSCRV